MLEERTPDALGGDGLGREIRGRDDRRPDQFGVGGGKIALRHQAELGGDAVDPLAAFGFQPPGSIERGIGEQPAARKHRLDA